MSAYRQLATSPESGSSEDNLVDKVHDDLSAHDFKARRGGLSSVLPRLSLAVCVLCTIVNLALSFYRPAPSAISQPISHTSLRREDIANLRRPSQFIGFDQVERQTPPLPRQIDNYPFLLAQVDAAAPSKVFEQDLRRYMAHVGTISHEDQRVLITQTISTIVQFRAVDWGMGTCEVRLSLPRLKPASSALLDSSQSRPLSIYRLNATKPLDPRKLSYETRPQRVVKLADVAFDPTASENVWHRKFACEEEEVLSFEIACGANERTGACEMEWWQDRAHPDPAVFMTQYATK